MESCTEKPADFNAENHIALPSKLTEICNFGKFVEKKSMRQIEKLSGTNSYVLELRFLIVCKISKTYISNKKITKFRIWSPSAAGIRLLFKKKNRFVRCTDEDQKSETIVYS